MSRNVTVLLAQVAIQLATSLGMRRNEQVIFQEANTRTRRAAKRSYAYVVKGYNRVWRWLLLPPGGLNLNSPRTPGGILVGNPSRYDAQAGRCSGDVALSFSHLACTFL